jgi:hypothetical protein
VTGKNKTFSNLKSAHISMINFFFIIISRHIKEGGRKERKNRRRRNRKEEEERRRKIKRGKGREERGLRRYYLHPLVIL